MAPPTSTLFKADAVLDSFFLLHKPKLACTQKLPLKQESLTRAGNIRNKKGGEQASQDSFSRMQRYLTNPTPRGSPVTLSFSKFFWTIWPYEENSSSNWSNVYDLQRRERDKSILVSLTMGKLNDKQTKTYAHTYTDAQRRTQTHKHTRFLSLSLAPVLCSFVCIHVEHNESKFSSNVMQKQKHRT